MQIFLHVCMPACKRHSLVREGTESAAQLLLIWALDTLPLDLTAAVTIVLRMEIDWRSGIPAHEQIARDLAQRIARHGYDAGERLPSRNVLAAAYDVSTATVSKAIAVLTEARLVIYRPGRGVVVEADGPHHAALMPALIGPSQPTEARSDFALGR